MMRSISLVAVLAFCASTPRFAHAQAPVLPWFNGFGISAGGGTMDAHGDSPSPAVSVSRPDRRARAGSIGGLLSLGTHRWALMLPEAHVQWGSGGLALVPGTLTLGSTTLPFTSKSRSVTSWAVLVGGQVALVPNGRAWVRGGIGSGGISSHLDTHEGLTVDLRHGNLGLALAGAGGVSVWTRSVENRRISLDAELHYLRIGGDQFRLTLPSARVGFRFHFVPAKSTK